MVMEIVIVFGIQAHIVFEKKVPSDLDQFSIDQLCRIFSLKESECFFRIKQPQGSRGYNNRQLTIEGSR